MQRERCLQLRLDCWDFLSPWLEVLRNRIKYKQVARQEDKWDSEKRVLEVSLPPRRANNCRGLTQEEFLYELQDAREALAVVAAVAHISQEDWKFVLGKIWGLKLGAKGSEEAEKDIPARFVLVMDHLAGAYPTWTSSEDDTTTNTDLIRFCGVHQRRHSTQEFLTALRQIAALDPKLKRDKPGVDVKIPVQVRFSDRFGPDFRQEFRSTMRAAKAIRREWATYEQSSQNQAVANGSLRCTFELAPMVAAMTDSMGYYEAAPMMETAVSDSAWFSQVSLSGDTGMVLSGDECGTVRDFGQLMRAVFDSTRRSPDHTNEHFYTDRRAYIQDLCPLQVNAVDFESFTGLEVPQLQAIMSALMLSQTTKEVSIRAEKKNHFSRQELHG